jgi:hypothetical protein
MVLITKGDSILLTRKLKAKKYINSAGKEKSNPKNKYKGYTCRKPIASLSEECNAS